MTVPQLFLADKLVTSHNPLPGMRHGRSRSGSFSDILPHSTRTTSPLPPSSLQSSTTVTEDALITSAPGEVLDLEPDPLPFAAEPIVATRPAPPPSYKSALQAVHVVQERPNTPELDPAGSSASSDTSDESLTDPRPSPTSTKSRHVNPNIVSISVLRLSESVPNRPLIDSHFLSISLLLALFSTWQIASMDRTASTDTITFFKRNITKSSGRMRNLLLARPRIGVSLAFGWTSLTPLIHVRF